MHLSGDTGGCVAALSARGYTRDLYSREVADGTGLWWVASFMNHDGRPSTARTIVGSFMLVTAARALPAGAELTTSYCSNARDLRAWGIA